MKPDIRILLIEDDQSFRQAVIQFLGVYHEIESAEDIASARISLAARFFDVVILDKFLPDGNGLSLVPEIKAACPNSIIIILTADNDFSGVKRALDAGADDYIVKSGSIIPDLLVRIPVTIERALIQRRFSCLNIQFQDNENYELTGKSSSTTDLRSTLLSLKGTNSPILIIGEIGSGKTRVARRLHALEEDLSRPFFSIHCAGITAEAAERELFGSYITAALPIHRNHLGLLELAGQGDVCLEDVESLPYSLQTKLAQALRVGAFKRSAGEKEIPISCRIIASTSQNLNSMSRNGRFNGELLQSLERTRLNISLLRDRREDILDLATALLRQLSGNAFYMTEKALKYLCQYDWPGNVTELRNTLERAIMASKRRCTLKIDLNDILLSPPDETSEMTLFKLNLELPSERAELSEKAFSEFMNAAEREYLKSALKLCNGNATEAAALVNLARSTMFRKLGAHGLIRKPQETRRLETSVS